MATDTGCMATAFSNASSSSGGTSVNPSIRTGRRNFLANQPQRPFSASYGQSSSESIPPLRTIQSNALSICPPSHPALPFVEHDTSSSSETETKEPVLMKFTPSTEPVVENAQHEPHWPWFLTRVTAPSETQSLSGGARTSAYSQSLGSAGSRRSETDRSVRS